MKEQIIMEKDEYGNWHETETSLKKRIQANCGFETNKIVLLDSYSTHGITEGANFLYNGFGWGISFLTDSVLITREEYLDNEPSF